jgi:uncharacterized protein YkwD
MLRGIQTAVAVLLLTLFSGVAQTANAQVILPHTNASDAIHTQPCKLSSHGLLASLRMPRFSQYVSKSNDIQPQQIQAVFATAHTENGFIDTSIGEESIESTPTVTTIPEQTADIVLAQAAPAPADGSLNADVLFNMINTHRSSIGLPPFQKDAGLCSVAQSRAPELYSEVFGGYMHAGFYARNLPYWATENMIHQDTEQAAFNWWMNSSVHRGAIEGNYTHACGACQGKSCAMIFTSFVPK